MSIKNSFELFAQKQITLNELIRLIKHSKQKALSIRCFGRNSFYHVGEEAFLSMSPIDIDNLDFFISNLIPDKFWRARKKYKENFNFYGIDFEFFLYTKWYKKPIATKKEWRQLNIFLEKEYLGESYQKIKEKDINSISLFWEPYDLPSHFEQPRKQKYIVMKIKNKYTKNFFEKQIKS